MMNANGETVKTNKKTANIMNANGESLNTKETDTIKGNNDHQQTEHFKQRLEPISKKLKKEINVKIKDKKESEQLPASKNITVLNNVVIQLVYNNILCGVCHTNVKKSQLTCSACSKTFHSVAFLENIRNIYPTAPIRIYFYAIIAL